MSRADVLSHILSTGVVAVIRMKDTHRLKKVIEAVREGGVKCIEITMTVPGAVDIITELSQSIPSDVLIGAGTVLEVKTAIEVIDAGAKFVVSPIFNIDVMNTCRERDTVVMPGCYSPTEIYGAWQAGADIVKVFPATSVGPKYLKDIHGPFPDIRFMPTGGVTVENVGEWILAGAAAVGIGSDLLEKRAIDEGRYEVLIEKATRMVKNFQQARKAVSS